MADAPSTDPLSLSVRAGLPEDLRFLLGDYPRRIWGDHPNFGPQTRFYLDRHAMFREAMQVMQRLTQEGLDAARPPAAYARDFGRVASFFLRELSTLHQVEDQHYFPMLTRAAPRLASHQPVLQFVDRRCRQPPPVRRSLVARGRLRDHDRPRRRHVRVHRLPRRYRPHQRLEPHRCARANLPRKVVDQARHRLP